MWWSSSSGEIELEFNKRQLRSVCKMGANDEAVERLLKYPSIKDQLDKLDPDLVAKVVKEAMCGEISDEELDDDDANLQRLVWIACWDLFDDPTVDTCPSKTMHYFYGTVTEVCGEYESVSHFIFSAPKDEVDAVTERIAVEWRWGRWDKEFQFFWFDGNAYHKPEVRKIKKSEFNVLNRFLSDLTQGAYE